MRKLRISNQLADTSHAVRIHNVDSFMTADPYLEEEVLVEDLIDHVVPHSNVELENVAQSFRSFLSSGSDAITGEKNLVSSATSSCLEGGVVSTASVRDPERLYEVMAEWKNAFTVYHDVVTLFIKCVGDVICKVREIHITSFDETEESEADTELRIPNFCNVQDGDDRLIGEFKVEIPLDELRRPSLYIPIIELDEDDE